MTATWIEARAEDLATLGLPAARLVTFGQSIHWTDRQPVLATVYELLAPGGAVALIAPAIDHPSPVDPPAPPIPHDEIEALLGHYLGWSRSPRVDTYETSLEQSPFGRSHVAYAPGRTDIVRTTDEVVSGYFSMSFADPTASAIASPRSSPTSERCSPMHPPAGRFHDWPGDTAIIWATKPA